jgi:hypothetical protein
MVGKGAKRREKRQGRMDLQSDPPCETVEKRTMAKLTKCKIGIRRKLLIVAISARKHVTIPSMQKRVLARGEKKKKDGGNGGAMASQLHL